MNNSEEMCVRDYIKNISYRMDDLVDDIIGLGSPVIGKDEISHAEKIMETFAGHLSELLHVQQSFRELVVLTNLYSLENIKTRPVRESSGQETNSLKPNIAISHDSNLSSAENSSSSENECVDNDICADTSCEHSDNNDNINYGFNDYEEYNGDDDLLLTNPLLKRGQENS